MQNPGPSARQANWQKSRTMDRKRQKRESCFIFIGLLEFSAISGGFYSVDGQGSCKLRVVQVKQDMNTPYALLLPGIALCARACGFGQNCDLPYPLQRPE